MDSKPEPELEDFDPLLSKERNKNISSPEEPVFTKGLTNPVYSYFGPGGSLVNGNTKTFENSRNDQALLQEYGLDFNNFSIKMNMPNTATTSTNCDPFTIKKQEWTTFD